MSKTLTLLIGLLIVIAGILMFRNYSQHAPSSEPLPLATMPGNEKNSNWREFISISGHFKVMLPVMPQHVSDRILDPNTKELRKYETFIAASDGGEAFMISAITFTHSVEEEKGGDSLKAVINDVVARNKINKLNAMSQGRLRTFQTFDFSISSGDRQIEGKVFAKGSTVYLLSMINLSDRFNSHDFDTFVNSFEITSGKPQ
ncbi:MAG: hypothetical protein WCF65_08925 [Parachlamydiaceae bacterium]